MGALPLLQTRAYRTGRFGLVEIAAGGFGQGTHDLAHIALGRSSRFGDGLFHELDERLARKLSRQKAFLTV